MANTSATTIKSCAVRPQSSISRLVDQLKQSSLNEHDTPNFIPLLAGCADQFHRMQLEQNQQQSFDLNEQFVQPKHPISLAFESGSTSKSKAVPIQERQHSRDDHSRAVHFTDVFTASSSACSSDSNRAVSEPEDEIDSSQWQPDSSTEQDPYCYQLFSTSAPTSHSVQSSRPLLTQIDSTTNCQGFCCSQNHPNPNAGPLNSGCSNLPSSLGPGNGNLCSSPNLYPYHSQAKRACRSLSASSAVQHLAHPLDSNQSSNRVSKTTGPITTNHSCSMTTNHQDSQLMQSTIKELETHINTLPRPIAIRPDSKNGDKPIYLSSVDSPRGYINGVPLRSKPSEPVCGSRLSWHHPVFTTGSGCRSHPPNYVSRSSMMQNEAAMVSGITTGRHHSVQCHNHHLSRRPMMLACGRYSGNWSQTVCSVHGTNPFVPTYCSETDNASGSILIHPLQSPSSAFTPTRNSLIQYEMGNRSSGCSLSPDADSAFSSVQMPARTPSSGFHEASFSGLSETSSLPDCSKFGVNHPTDQSTGHHPTKDKPNTSKVSSDVFFPDGFHLDFQKCELSTTGQSCSVPAHPLNPPVSLPCSTSSNSSSSSSSVTSAATSGSAIRCRSQPSVTSEFPSSESKSAPIPCDSSACTVGLKRRRGPSGDSNHNNNDDNDRFKPPSLFYIPTNDPLDCTPNSQMCPNLDFSGISPRSHAHSHCCPHTHTHHNHHHFQSHAPNNHPYHFQQQQQQLPNSSCTCKISALPSPSSVTNPTSSSCSSFYCPGYSGSCSMLSHGQPNCVSEASKAIFVFGSNPLPSLSDRSTNHHDTLSNSCTCPVCPDLSHPSDSSLILESCESKTKDSEESSTTIDSDHSWHQTVNPDIKPIRTNFDFDGYTSYRHVCNELSELSESIEEEKEYETPETITEEIGSHSNQSITSPSIQEVTFAPIRQSSEIWDNEPISVSEEVPINHPHLHYPRYSYRPIRLTKDLVDPLTSSSRTNDFYVSLSSSNSDSSDSESILSPQMPDRQLQCQSHLIGSTTDSTQLNQPVSFTDLDLDLIENN